MDAQRPGMLVPAMIGGAIAGFLTALPFVGCLCCIWMIGGGMLAAYFLTKDSQVPLTAGDGAIVGIFAGIAGAVVDAVVSIPFDAMMRDSAFLRNILDRVAEYMEEVPAGWENLFEQGPLGQQFSLPWFILGLAISVVIFSVFSALGGIIGVSLFRKKDVTPQETGDAP